MTDRQNDIMTNPQTDTPPGNECRLKFANQQFCASRTKYRTN